MKRAIEFIRCEHGQDLVEYALLLAFICVSGVALFLGMSKSTNTIWSAVNSRMASANQSH